MAPEVEEPWISKASELEKLYEEAHQNGIIILVYQLSLCTVNPLQEEHVRRSLVHLQSKCPILRMCYGKRDGITWFRKSEEGIDFQVVTDTEADETRVFLLKYRFNSEKGPLWCARLVLDEKDSYVLDEGFPYSYQLILAIHHGIADGFSILKICGGFVKILEKVASGEPVCDKEQIGRFVSDTENESLVFRKKDVIQNDPALMQELSESEKDHGIGMPLLLSVFLSPDERKGKTHSLTYVLNRDATKHFIDRCKAEGVTVHSAFSALANASIVKILVEKQFIKDSYRICNGHAINLRRYWLGNSSQVLGCHTHFPLNLWTNVPQNVQKSNFWGYARTLHQDLHHHLKEESPILRDAFTKLNVPEANYDDIFNSTDPMQLDCLFSNLGNITSVLTEGGLHVKPYLLKRCMSLHRTCSNLAHFFVTFRGRLTLDLLYNTTFYTSDIPKKHCDQIFSMLDEVIKQ